MDAPTRPPVLVVDPDRAICTLIMAVLKRGGYDAEAADSAEEALRISRTRPHSAVILEPRMHRGEALLDALYSVAGDGKPNVIVVTTSDGSASSYVAPAHGRRVLFKPLRIDELAEVVADCCDGNG